MDQSALSDRLLPGERLVWSGRPGQGLLFTGRDVLLVPFSLLWCGFALFWEVTATHDHAPGFFPLFGAMFVWVGLYFVFGRFLVDAWVRQGMAYGLTDRRALISKPWPFADFVAVSLDRMSDANLKESGSGRGTIRFGQAAPMWGGRGMSTWSPALDPTPQFLAITDARTVFDLIQRSSTSRA